MRKVYFPDYNSLLTLLSTCNLKCLTFCQRLKPTSHNQLLTIAVALAQSIHHQITNPIPINQSNNQPIKQSTNRLINQRQYIYITLQWLFVRRRARSWQIIQMPCPSTYNRCVGISVQTCKKRIVYSTSGRPWNPLWHCNYSTQSFLIPRCVNPRLLDARTRGVTTASHLLYVCRVSALCVFLIWWLNVCDYCLCGLVKLRCCSVVCVFDSIPIAIIHLKSIEKTASDICNGSFYLFSSGSYLQYITIAKVALVIQMILALFYENSWCKFPLQLGKTHND
jgi:hypothetical protein